MKFDLFPFVHIATFLKNRRKLSLTVRSLWASQIAMEAEAKLSNK